MKLLSVSKIICGLFSIMFVLTSCSNAVFPDIDDETNELVVDGPDKKFIQESKSLASDSANVAYEDDNVSITSKSYKPEKEEKIASAKIKPVTKSDSKGYSSSKTITNDPTLNKLLETGEPSVERASIDSDYGTAETTQPLPQTFSVTYQVATFLFENGSSTLSSEYNSQIREIVKLAKENNAVVSIYGYASSRTRNTDIATHKMTNFEVSSQRADSVLRALRKAGLSANQIRVEALSDSNPSYLEVMPEGERLNRRAEVYISY